MSGTQPNPGQRGVSPVAGNAKPLISRKVLAIGVLVVAVGVLGFLAWKSSNPPEPPVQEKLPSQLSDNLPYSPPQMLIPPKPTAIPVAATPALPHFQPQPKPADPAPLVLPKTDPVVHAVGGAVIPPPTPPKPYMLTFADAPKPVGHDGQPGMGQDASAGASSITYASSSIDGIKAGLMGDQTFKLSPGLLTCYLDTAVSSTFAGPIECHIPENIRPHGVTLLDRGSVVHGTYSNNIQTGQARLFVAADWVEDKTTGCFVKFDNAPVADSIGQAGVAGNVDPHNLERFSAAMLLTGFQSAESLAQAGISKGGNTYLSLNGGSGGVDTIASAILRKQIDIPPTITLQQGQAISVFLIKPLDFSPCYDLKIKDR